MNSIITNDDEHCYLCGGVAVWNDPLDTHHIFNGANRAKSEKYGLKVKLHHNKCHCFGRMSVHKNAKIDNDLKAYAQSKAMKKYGWSIDDFIKIFGKNYI